MPQWNRLPSSIVIPSDDAPQWIKQFMHETKGTCPSQNEWFEPFSLSFGKAAKSWYRPLSRKTKQTWKLLSADYAEYYCSENDESTRSRYYSAKRHESENVYDFLLRLNGYARSAQIEADEGDHVEHFLTNCGYDHLMDFIYPQPLGDTHWVEQIIRHRLLGENGRISKTEEVAVDYRTLVETMCD